MKNTIKENDLIIIGTDPVGNPRKAIVMHVISATEVKAIYNDGKFSRPKAVEDNFVKTDDGNWEFRYKAVSGIKRPNLNGLLQDFF